MKIYLFVLLLFGILINCFAQNTELDHLIDAEKKYGAIKQNFVVTPFSSTNDLIYHRINWKVDPQYKYISGSVCSYVKILQDNVSHLHFDLAEPLIVDSVVHKTGNLNFTHTNSVIEIQLSKTLNTNEIDSLTIYYHGVPPGSSGFGSFIVEKHNNIPILWTLSEPYGAKEWWPCKQNLFDKIDSLDIYITVPVGNKVGSNGVLIGEQISNNDITYHWKHKHPIANYLVAIAVTNYAEFKDYADVGNGKKVEILNYVYPEQLAENEAAAQYTVDVMELFSQLFISYPFADEKYGHAQFGWSGGMEHQTMSFMGGFSKDLIAHELAHQWFGNHVTCGSWKDIWINEGFATYLTGISQEHLSENGLTKWKQNIIKYKLPLPEMIEGSVIVDDTTSVNRIFSSALSYNKAGFVLHMLRTQIGDDAFFEGCKLLLSDSQTAGKFAHTPQVQSCFETTADTNLTAFFNEWIYGQGYPQFTVYWDQSIDQTVTLKIIQKTTHQSVTCYKMYIPILLKGSGNEKLVRFHQINAEQTFTYNPGFAVDEVVFDANYDLLAPHPANVTLKIFDETKNDELQVYPNPAKNKLVIRTEKHKIIEEISIISIKGKKVDHFTNTNKHKKITFDISTYNNGIYFIKAKVNNKEIIQRFIKN